MLKKVEMTQVSLSASDHRISQKRRSCDDGDDSPAQCRRSKTNTSSKSNIGTKRYACHFYVASPKSFENTTCAHSSWRDIPRLKEHLYRRHYQRRISCERCLVPFQHENELLAHRRQAVPCEIAEMKVRDPVVDGMDEKTMNALKSRKRSSPADEEEKWFDIWELLFPNRSRPDAPFAPDSLLQPADSLFARYLKDYLKTELPSLVRQSMEGSSTVKQESDALEDIISACIDSAVQQYNIPGTLETSPAASTILEPEQPQSKPPVPQFPDTFPFLPEPTEDFQLFSGEHLTTPYRHMSIGDISPSFSTLSCASGTTYTGTSPTSYSVSEASTNDTNCISSPLYDELPSIGVNFGYIQHIPLSSDGRYHVDPLPVDFNFSQTDTPAIFTGAIENERSE